MKLSFSFVYSRMLLVTKQEVTVTSTLKENSFILVTQLMLLVSVLHQTIFQSLQYTTLFHQHQLLTHLKQLPLKPPILLKSLRLPEASVPSHQLEPPKLFLLQLPPQLYLLLTMLSHMLLTHMEPSSHMLTSTHTLTQPPMSLQQLLLMDLLPTHQKLLQLRSTTSLKQLPQKQGLHTHTSTKLCKIL